MNGETVTTRQGKLQSEAHSEPPRPPLCPGNEGASRPAPDHPLTTRVLADTRTTALWTQAGDLCQGALGCHSPPSPSR